MPNEPLHQRAGRPLCALARLSAIIAITAVAPALWAKETLHASFELNIDGKQNGRTITGQHTGELSFRQGKFGRALAVGGRYGHVRYSGAGIVSPTEGTVSLWVKPMDWQPNDGFFHVFFDARGSGGLFLYKYHDNSDLLLVSTQDANRGPFYRSGKRIDWKPGQWYHVVGTWQKTGVLLYVDGEPVSSNPFEAELPLNLAESFLIGDLGWHMNRSSHSLIDEVRIFDTALPPDAVKRLYRSNDVDDRTATAKPSSDHDNDGGEQPPFPWEQAQPNIKPRFGPVRIESGEIDLGNRLYRFENSPWPTQLLVNGQPLLAAPPFISTGNASNAAPVLTSTGNGIDGALFNGELITAGARLDVQTRVASDGLISTEIRLKEGNFPPDQELTLNLPLYSDVMTRRMRWLRENASEFAGLEGDDMEDMSSFRPYYWFGNDEMGLYWFSESHQGWPAAVQNDAIRLVKKGGQLTFALKLKSPGQVLPSNWTYRFGLQATPVKSYPRDWRRWRIAPAAHADIDLIWPAPDSSSLKYYGYPEATDPQRFHQRVTAIQRRGRSAVSYLCPTFISTASPEWKRFRSQWSTGNYDSVSADVRAYGAAFAQVLPGVDSWRRFFVNKTAEFVNDSGLDGVYFDNSTPFGLYAAAGSAEHGIKSARYKRYPMGAYRELYAATIQAIKSAKPDARVIVHSSGQIAIPMLSQADAYVSGEQFRGQVRDDYLEVLSLEQLRTEFMGRQWGLIPIFLPQFNEEAAKKSAPTRGLMALLMLHDILIWPLWCNVDEVNRSLLALDRYGYQNAEFVPYFSDSPPAKVDSEDMLISAYRKDRADQLLVIANVRRAPAAGRICVAGAANMELKLTDWMTDRPIGHRNGCFELDLPKQDYKLVRVEAG